ncbi:MAG: isoaspartyl peptidase/L-asparaginase [Bacteroidota bacterium]|nr:isoaspartyl peptidase/L-asparaginase [Bacteroidota bacterium]
MIAFIVHGGAWDIPDDQLGANRAGVEKALTIGWEILSNGGSAVEAVEKAVVSLEDDPTFDAGVGSHVNAAGEIELDASIMNGTTFRAGAVAAVQSIRNPIALARKIMDESEHILLAGSGAVRFALEHGMQRCSNDELLTGRELELWRTLQGRKSFSTKEAFRKKISHDTVGAVALDSDGVIVSGTSTGGTQNKYPGRVGDSPLIGCGTYADSAVGGASCTGWGEAIIKVVLAKTAVDLLERNSADSSAAAAGAIERLVKKADGFGGIILLNHRGVPGVAFNTPRMARAYLTSEMNHSVVEV